MTRRYRSSPSLSAASRDRNRALACESRRARPPISSRAAAGGGSGEPRFAAFQTLRLPLQTPHAPHDACEQQLGRGQSAQQAGTRQYGAQSPGASAFIVGPRLSLCEEFRLPGLHGFDLGPELVEHGLVGDQASGYLRGLKPGRGAGIGHGRQLGQTVTFLDDQLVDTLEPLPDLTVARRAAEPVERVRQERLGLDIGFQKRSPPRESVATDAAGGLGQQGMDLVDIPLDRKGQPDLCLGLGLRSP
jgi:hypothetical protein